MRRFVLFAAFSMVGLAGCNSPVPTDMDATEALARATEAAPGLELFSLRGIEGPFPQRGTAFLALRDDGLDDGPLGDGRLSSWVAAFVSPDGLLEVQVFANGAAPVKRTHTPPDSFADEQGFLPRATRLLDSEEAAQIAKREEPFMFPPMAGSFLYTYASRCVEYAVTDGHERLEPYDLLAWPRHDDTWVVAWIPDGDLPAVSVAAIDASDGSERYREMTVPLVRQLLLEDQVEIQDPAPAPGASGTVHRFTFTVDEWTGRLEGMLRLYGGSDTRAVDPWTVRVVGPDGIVHQELEGSPRDDAVLIEEPPIGEWTIEVTHRTPLPQSAGFTMRLHALVPVLP